MKNATNYRRFIERDYVKRQMETNSEYIFSNDIEAILNERQDWSDYTFGFSQISSGGWHTTVYDNIYEHEVILDDLNPFAMDYYIRQLVDLTKKKYLVPKELSMAI